MPDDDIIVATEEDIKAAAAAKPAVPVSPDAITTGDLSRPTPTLALQETGNRVSETETTVALSGSSPSLSPVSDTRTSSTLPGDARVQQALRAVATAPAPKTNVLGGVTEALEKATRRAQANADESVLPQHAATMGAFSAPATASTPAPSQTAAVVLPGKELRGPTNFGLKVMPKPKEEEFPQRDVRSTNPSVLRTYEADKAELIRSNKISMTTMALREAERERGEEREVEKSSHRTAFLVVGILIFLMLGSGVIFYFFVVAKTDQPEVVSVGTSQAQSALEPLLFTETAKSISLVTEKQKTPYQLLAREVADANLNLGAMEAVWLTEDGKRAVSVGELLNLVTRRVPPRLIRQISEPYTFGVLAGSVNSGFLILTTQNYDTVFADMLAWEPDLVRDLYAPLTGKEASKEVLDTPWKDTVVRNIDVRVLGTPGGDGSTDATTTNPDTQLVWGFVNQQTLVLAANPTTFREVLTRLTTPKPVSR